MSGTREPLVDVVVATYGHPELLARCLASLAAMDFRDYRLIVVDDASPETIVPVVQTHHPGATVIRARRNGGLVRALNKGISRGQANLVALLNDDTEVSPDWLAALVEAAKRYPMAGSFASKILLFDDPPRFHSAGDGFGAWGMPFNRGIWLDDLGQYDREEQVFGACAGAALYRRDVLERVSLPGGRVFDPAFFMYLEDVDLAWRIQRAGYDCVYIPKATVRHHLSASGGGRLASYYVSRNIWAVLLHAMPRPVLTCNLHRILAHHVGKNARHLRHFQSAEARASLRGTFAGPLLALRMIGRRGKLVDRRADFPVSMSR